MGHLSSDFVYAGFRWVLEDLRPLLSLPRPRKLPRIRCVNIQELVRQGAVETSVSLVRATATPPLPELRGVSKQGGSRPQGEARGQIPPQAGFVQRM